MVDNIGNEIHIGDSVFCFSGKYKNQVMQVESFRIIKDVLFDREAVNFSSRDWLSAENVVSLTALGAVEKSPGDSVCKYQDALGNPLQVGDRVLFLRSMKMYAEIGIVKSLAQKSCLLAFQAKYSNKTEYRKKYEEVISLTAIGKDNLVIEHHDFDVGG